MSKRIHVVPHGNDWAVRREGNNRATSVHPTQNDAINAGRPIAQDQKTELVIHRPNGTIRDADSYGNDSNPPKDTKH
jgi:hypothetical protein